jgi:D-arabinose 5-phosphate isomerase GutQ
MMPCASTLGVIAAWDAIILAVMRVNGFTKEQFLRIHPGGATGETLRDFTGGGR